MPYELRAVTSADDWRHLHAIRRAVLFAPGRHDIAYDESHPDDRADGNQPYLLVLDGDAIGVARLDVRDELAVLRLVAIVDAAQGKGHGRAFSDLLDAEARRLGVAALRVNAAPDAVGYYEKTGWRRESWDARELAGLAASTVQMTKRL